MIGYAMCGSFCTLGIALDAMKKLVASGLEIQPIMSENAYFTNTRFFEAEQLRRQVEAVTGKNIISNVVDAEPLGPKLPLEALIIAPCTGNTLAKMANGITDTAVTMAAKAHLRSDRPLLIALASNDALSQNLASIGAMLNRKSVYFVPLHQDDPIRKPHSLVADFELIQEALEAMLRGRQLRPMFV